MTAYEPRPVVPVSETDTQAIFEHVSPEEIRDVVISNTRSHPDWDIQAHIDFLFDEVVEFELELPTPEQVSDWMLEAEGGAVRD